MKQPRQWNEWVEVFRERGINLGAIGREIKLRCYRNGAEVILTLREAYEEFCRSEFRLVLPIDQFSYNVEGHSDVFCATESAGIPGVCFGMALKMTRFNLTRDRLIELFPSLKKSAFAKVAQRFRDLMACLPRNLVFFRRVKSIEGDIAGKIVYRRRAGRTVLFVEREVEAPDGTSVPWEIFDLDPSDASMIARAKKTLQEQRAERARLRQEHRRRRETACDTQRRRYPERHRRGCNEGAANSFEDDED